MVGNVERTAHHGMDSLLHDQYPRIFYAKKLDPAVSVMLTADVLNPEAFLSWWSRTGLTQDFWIETNDKLVRVHLVPRKSFFDPRKWQSKQHEQPWDPGAFEGNMGHCMYDTSSAEHCQ